MASNPGAHTMTIPHRLLPLLALALAACGDGDGDGDPVTFVEPDRVTFSYGAGQDASEASAPRLIAVRIGAAWAGTSAPGEGAALYALATQVIATPLDAAVQAFLDPEGEPPSSGSEVPSCVSVGPREVRWSCSSTSGDGSWFSGGSFTRSPSAFVWDVSSGSESSGSADSGPRTPARTRTRARGSLVVESGHVSGRARVDLEGRYGISGDLLHSAYTTSADVDLWLDEEGCPTAGTVEVKLLWAIRPFESQRDEGVRYSWSGCGVVSAAFASR